MQFKSILKELYLNNYYDLTDSSLTKKSDLDILSTGISEIDLIKKVAKELAKVILNFCNDNDSFLCVIGAGNNGSDGLALAKILQELNFNVKVIVIETVKHQELLSDLKGDIYYYSEQILSDLILKSDYLIDAILGVGQTRSLDGKIKEIVKLINQSKIKKIAIDVPTGFNSDNGKLDPDWLIPDCTILIQAPKKGMIHHEYIFGEIYIIDLGYSFETNYRILNIRDLKFKIPKISNHKKTNSELFIIGGSLNFSGGHSLTVKSAIRSGATYLKTFRFPSSNLPDEVIAFDIKSDLSIDELEIILDNITESSVLSIGSAMGRNFETKELFSELIKLPNKKIIDADGINLLSEIDEIPKNSILTPHLKEASRLLDISVEDVKNNLFEVAKTLALSFDSIIVLKGHGTIITDGTEFYINPTGNPYLATAGTGDVLAGIISGLSCTLDLFEAAKLGVFVHGYSADLIVENGFPLIASDLIEQLPITFKKIYDTKFNY